jgi:hypothetical protein
MFGAVHNKFRLDINVLNWQFPSTPFNHMKIVNAGLHNADNQIRRVYADYQANKRLMDPDYASLGGEHPEDVVSQEHYTFVFCHLYALALWSESTGLFVDVPTVALDGHGALGLTWDQDGVLYGGACAISTDRKLAWFQGDHALVGSEHIHYRSKGIAPQDLIVPQLAMLCFARESIARIPSESADNSKDHTAIS